MSWIFHIDYLAVEARGYSVERYGVIREHREVFVRAETLEDAVAEVREWFPTKYGPNYDFGEVWKVKRHRTSEFLDVAGDDEGASP